MRLPASYDRAHELAGRIESRRGAYTLRPCHDDLLAANFVHDGTQLRIVDWEYAGMGDPAFDLANFAVNNSLDEDGDRELLDAYGGADLDVHVLMRFMSDFREATWALVQQAVSQLEFDFVVYGEEHFERLQRTAAEPRFRRALDRKKQNRSATPWGSASTGQRTSSIRYCAAALSLTVLPRSGLRPEDDEAGVPAARRRVAPSRAGERRRGLHAAAGSPSPLTAGDRRRRGSRAGRASGRRDRDSRPGRLRAASCADVPGSTCPGVVRYSEPKTIRSAPSRSARSRSPSGVEPLRTTCCGTSGSPSQRAPLCEQLLRLLGRPSRAAGSGSGAWRT